MPNIMKTFQIARTSPEIAPVAVIITMATAAPICSYPKPPRAKFAHR